VKEKGDGQGNESQERYCEKDQKCPWDLVVVMLEPVAEVKKYGGDDG